MEDFKWINDTHVHAAGDTVLRYFAAALPRGPRPEDTVARLGGGAFAVMLAGAADMAALSPRPVELSREATQVLRGLTGAAQASLSSPELKAVEQHDTHKPRPGQCCGWRCRRCLALALKPAWPESILTLLLADIVSAQPSTPPIVGGLKSSSAGVAVVTRPLVARFSWPVRCCDG
ncbi:diguanylate cyclase [Diaphorobacter sp. HDW4A]|uniref:GGDEF domain-containing protein n=1 Tax=Comamonadaceae TaxID=80864 RepID=UPI00140E4D63|nr:diguanylate cyclase [Diaphorobacter sp. HDW4A]QIL83655.1 diguanylate cyclase [Diaphorobacter sp. HDW4A]